MKRFSGCWFGPYELRNLLRSLDASPSREKLIGWGVVQQRDGLGMSVVIALLGFVPGVGPLLAMSKSGDYSRFFVLTDRTLLVLKTDQRDPASPAHPPAHQIPLESLAVEQTVEEHVFEIGIIKNQTSDTPAQRLGTFEVLRSDAGPPARLCEALRVLATDGDSARA